MDFLSRLNKALDYIENNLDEEIDYKTIEILACFSLACFQRMFSCIDKEKDHSDMGIITSYFS